VYNVIDSRAGPRASSPRRDEQDVALLRSLGYEQQLKRGLHIADNVAIGFAAISPVVALYGVVGVGLVLAGPAWVWMLPVALAGQCLVLVLYGELASEFPIANATYQWSRRLVGPSYGWLNGWMGLCAYAAANATIAYLAAPWALTLVGIEPTPTATVITGMLFVALCALINAMGLDTLKTAVRIGITAELIASVFIGAALLVSFREHGFTTLGDTMDAEALSGGSSAAALIAALAIGGWVFIGFDACGLSAEETRDSAHQVPRAVWIAMLTVGAVVILNAVAITLAHPDLEAVVAGDDAAPVTTAVVAGFGSWIEKPFAAVTLVAFVACGMAAQGITARAIYSVARDGVLPGSAWLAHVNARRVPFGSIVVTTVVAWVGLLLGLNAGAIGTLISYGTAGIYAAFLMLAAGALWARLSGTWVPSGALRLGRAGLVCNVLAVGWLVFETINIAWPRTSTAPPGAPWYQVWAAPMVIAISATVGTTYLLIAKPQRKLKPAAGISARRTSM
jgi:amino acid transporter